MVVRYYHDFIGVNSRLDSMQAAVLEVKLQHLDEYIAARQQAAAYYDAKFSGNDKLIIPARNAASTHVFLNTHLNSSMWIAQHFRNI
jgi:dTDP-4-amino-4,6-dideoxygalactose transaminase